MNLLLDTNTLVWALDERRIKSLGKQAQRIIKNSDLVYFSSISLAELQIKATAGKFKNAPDVARALADGFLLMDFKAEHAQVINKFPSLIRHDPFDRMLLAQAFSEQLVLLTSDVILLDLGLNYVLDARD
ncbi:type II toxin-antitoxin system VapC family toxin [Candidatus Saccharibacteria bacterium]|nr:type II toxin-antitoxin system VapC family toxin [Candidatus Saccharibacteria bacterium]